MDAIADNLNRIREARNLSLEQLAERTGVSKSMLRQIETGNSNPTIATIWKIANGLRVSFTSLLREPEVEAEVKSFTRNDPLTGADSHYRLYPMVPFDPEKSFETYYLEIDPNTSFTGEPHEGNVYEYVYVTAGRLQVTVDGNAFEIYADEFLQFQANCPHEYTCLGRKMVTAILQISYLS